MATTTNVVTNTPGSQGFGWICTDTKEGVDLNNPLTINTTTNPEVPANPIPLGTRIQGLNNSEWVRVLASTTVSQNSLVAIDVNFSCNPLTTTLASSNIYTYGLCQIGTQQATNCQPGDYFWALLRASGGATLNVSATAAKGAQLYIATAQSGAATTTASGTALKNIYVNTALTGSSAFVDVVIPSYITVST
jgi:hypothetical protein